MFDFLGSVIVDGYGRSFYRWLKMSQLGNVMAALLIMLLLCWCVDCFLFWW